MTINFSVLMCSRSRPEILEQNVTNIKLLASDPDSVQILIGADDDDLPTVDKVRELQDQFINIELSVYPRFKNLHKFYNLLASQAAGRYIWGMNDDSFMEYPNFDIDFANQIEGLIAPHPDRIGYFAISSNSSDTLGDYGEFPIVTREGLKAVGFMDYEGVAAWGCDRVMQRIYQSVNRAFHIKVDRPMRHLFHEGGTAPNENRTFMEKQFANQFGENWGEAVRNMKEFIETVDVSPFSSRLQEKINEDSNRWL